jgi:hypothetical protein
MKNFTRKSVSSQPAAETAVYLFDDWFDPIEAGVRDRVREIHPVTAPEERPPCDVRELVKSLRLGPSQQADRQVDVPHVRG